jgi:hypothetical protein
MVSVYEPPISQLVAALLVAVGVGSAAWGLRRVARGLRQARSLEVARGLRGCVIAIAAGLFAIGLLAARRDFLLLGAVFLAEELYETGVLTLIIRSGERGGSDDSRPGTPPAGAAARA